MRIAVLSDTHIPTRLGSLQGRVYEEIADSDLIIHAGDLVEMDVLRDLERFAEVRAVRGNMDDASLRRVLPERQVFELEGFRIAVMHGSGAPFGLSKRVLSAVADEDPRIVIHGHSHQYCNRSMGNVLVLNPGAVVDRSFAVLSLEEGTEPFVERFTF